jgi:7,8-dihydropterin-6-yl-methyl-4-(beta-D-ribofuranosyl)aminobenzene 5'-phosphate synthase
MKDIDLHMGILYDNNRFDPRLKAMWGFSCLVEGLGKTVLFDTGGDGDTLLSNVRLLGVEAARIDIVVLSHIHGDHTGGLGKFLEKNPHVAVYLPDSFPASFKKAVTGMGAHVEEVSEARAIFPGAYTTGEIGDGIREQALALKTASGLVVITGCAHPGIVSMVRRAREISAQGRVDLVVGGFHLRDDPPSRIKSIAEKLRLLSVKRVSPCHCSGDATRILFRQKFGPDYIESGVGKTLQIQ